MSGGAGGVKLTLPPQEKLPSKNPALSGLKQITYIPLCNKPLAEGANGSVP